MPQQERSITFHTSRFRFFWAYVIFFILLVGGALAYRLGYNYMITLPVAVLGVLCLVINEIKIRSDKILIKSCCTAIP